MKRARTFVILSVLVFCAFLLRGDLCIAQTATTQPSQPSVKRIAQIRIEGRVGERPAQFELFGTTSETLWSYIERLEKARSSDAICAANGVLFLDPLNPFNPELDHDNTFPWGSVMVTIVLLNED